MFPDLRSRGHKRVKFAVNIDSCSITKKLSLSSFLRFLRCFYESKIKTTSTFILAKLCQTLSGRGK